MAEEETKKLEAETPSEPPPPPPLPDPVELPKEVVAEEEEKALVPAEPISVPPVEEKGVKDDESKALALVEKAHGPVDDESAEGSVHRDSVLARVTTEKRESLIKAWEDSEKSKAENKAQKKISEIGAWENSKQASLEAELRKNEQKLEKQKAAYVEKLKNQVAQIHKAAEEKRAFIEAQRGEDLIKTQETAAKYIATGTGPKKFLGCC